VAGIDKIADPARSRLTQTAEAVVLTALRANEAGKVIAIPGWHNRLAVALMRTLPEPLVRAAIAAGSAKYRL
jgi:short-subunit dehydrogenase